MPLLDLGMVPVFCNVQWDSQAKARAATSGPLKLKACLDCGHGFNESFDASRLAYAPGYENSQHASSVFRDYATRLVDHLVDRYQIRDRAVVDIGCGRGDLLAMLCERGGNRGFGFDPSYAGTATPDPARRFTIAREYFGPEQAASIQPSLICCRHVLEHVEDPGAFLHALHAALEASGDCVLYLEVPSGEELLSSLGLWDYLYEHVSYFSAQSLSALLSAAGFELIEMRRAFGGQFLCAEVRVASRPVAPSAPQGDWLETLRAASQGLEERLAHWKRWAEELPPDTEVSLWGAGSKGVMFVNLLGLRAPGALSRVIDQNSDKHGRFVSGMGQLIVGPESLRGGAVDLIVLMNGIYEAEVRSRMQELGVAPRLLIA